MENLCDKCKQEDCPRCIEKSKERNKWLSNIFYGALLLFYAYRVGVATKHKEEDSNEDQEKDSNKEEES